MARFKKNGAISETEELRPMISPEIREARLMALAQDVAEEQLANRTASSAVICHYLKLATVKSQLELENLRQDNMLKSAKTDTLKSQESNNKLYAEVLQALKGYRGEDVDSTPYEDEDF